MCNLNPRHFKFCRILIYDKNGGMKKQLYDTTLRVDMVKEILGRQNSTINAFMKLQIFGMTEDEILFV